MTLSRSAGLLTARFRRRPVRQLLSNRRTLACYEAVAEAKQISELLGRFDMTISLPGNPPRATDVPADDVRDMVRRCGEYSATAALAAICDLYRDRADGGFLPHTLARPFLLGFARATKPSTAEALRNRGAMRRATPEQVRLEARYRAVLAGQIGEESEVEQIAQVLTDLTRVGKPWHTHPGLKLPAVKDKRKGKHTKNKANT